MRAIGAGLSRAIVASISLIFISASMCQSANGEKLTEDEECLLQVIHSAPDHMTIGEAKAQCKEPLSTNNPDANTEKVQDQKGIVEERLSADDKNILKPYTLMAHKSNYILLAAQNFNGWNSEYHEEISKIKNIEFNDAEIQFQLSIKTPLAVDLFNERVDIFAAYTVRSFWQFYNNDISSPFRETDHEPEAWIQVRPEFEFLGFKHNATAIGISHQSNGQAGALSRSWNRIYAIFGFEKDNFAFMLKPWIRIPEAEDNDDNPDIIDYMGHGELGMAFKHKDHTFTFMTRNNLESGFSQGAIEAGWSFPLSKYKFFRGYIQYFSGYGISLLDYNQYVNQIGIGLLLTDVL